MILQQIPNANLIHTRLNNKPEEVNLKAIKTMQKYFGKRIAFGNHCELKEVLFSAVALNPSDYFIYVKDEDYHDNIPPDLNHAININFVDYYANTIKLLEKTMGSGEKTIEVNQIEGQE